MKDIGTNRNVEDTVWFAFQEAPETSRFLRRHSGKAGGKPYRTRCKRRVEFEVGKGLLDWNSLIAIGD